MTKLKHVQSRRKYGDYCRNACALCYLAATDALSGRAVRARTILALGCDEAVEIEGETDWLNDISTRLPKAVVRV